MQALNLFKCLADDTRLKIALLIRDQGELCVCELTTALDTSQPKVSRHLAQLRDCELLTSRKEGQWVYYAINPELPDWARQVINSAASGNSELTGHCCERLLAMGDRPQRNRALCGDSA